MTAVTCFPALANPGATVLILGSMPGVASLAAQQSYAHPRNHFWPIMADIAGFDPAALYAARVAALTRSGIAVWDVLQSCVRPGSQDSAIQAGTRVPNDFAAFFAAHPWHHACVFQRCRGAEQLPQTCVADPGYNGSSIYTPAIHQPCTCRAV